MLVRLLQVGDARAGVGDPVRHVDWRANDDDARALIAYEVGAGAWIGKLALTRPRAALRFLRARQRMLQTSSPWSDRRTAAVHRAALGRGVALGLWLGGGTARAGITERRAKIDQR